LIGQFWLDGLTYAASKLSAFYGMLSLSIRPQAGSHPQGLAPYRNNLQFALNCIGYLAGLTNSGG
jgi:hypothetical protein